MNFKYIKSFFALGLIFLLSSHKHEEGMFPLSQLDKVDFKQAGFNISQKDIYNPEGIALTDALVRLGGCTGSFVSEEGLIITNHHCVFGSVAGVSTKENDYLENGFHAPDKSKELKIGLTCKITLSYEDVSDKILGEISPKMSSQHKKELIQRNIYKLTQDEQTKNPELTIEISEMFAGYSYTLFRYQTLKDVRLVYVPPRTIGEFGGETDNWEWPKHTGDFSIVRAYVGKDGKPAEYNKENVPYKPKKHLKINPKGTKEKDLVFILGYPGTTYRHQPAQFLQYQQEHVLPFISSWFAWRMQAMEELGKTDRNRYLRMAGSIKSLANTKKNFEGKMFGLKQTDLLNQKMSEQNALKAKMQSEGYEIGFLDKIESIYAEKLKTAPRDMLLNRFNGDCGSLAAALIIENISSEYSKSDFKANKANWQKEVKAALKERYRILDVELDQMILMELFNRAEKLGEDSEIEALESIKNEKKFISKAYKKGYYDEPSLLYKLIDSLPDKVFKDKSNFRKLAKKLLPELNELSERQRKQELELENLLPQLLEAKIKYNNATFVPDANATLRFTYGYISGYKKELNKHPEPFTFRNEIFEKNATDNVDYRLSTSVRDLLKTERIAKELLDETTNDLVICMLYNMDTTGGNSGSPVMDANGNLVGVNFDRAYTATLNDFSWNKDYSRSIAVDIRYALFVMKYLDKADNLLNEMGVKI